MSDLINYCKKEGLYYSCILYGMINYILKKHVPLWLEQHLDILASYQEPLMFRGQGVLLILVELADLQMKENKKR